MHTSYTVGITTGEYLALQYVASDQKDYITNFVQSRAKTASDEIVQKYTTFKISKGEAITAVGTTAVVQAAYAEGVVGIIT